MKKILKISHFFLMVFLLSTLMGCDLISAVKDSLTKYFKGDKKQNVSQSAEQKAAPSNQPGPNTLAQVGSWSITKEEFDQRMNALKEVMPNINPSNPELKKQVLDELVKQQILVEEAEKTGLSKDKDIVAAVEEFRRTLIVREAARKIAETITATDQEAKEFYEQNKEMIKSPLEVRVREIVSLTEEKANELLTELKNGADFAQLAKNHSISESASQGGDLGILTEQPFDEMMQAVMSTKEGEISNVFKGPEGFYIIKVESKKGGEQLSYEEVKDEIKQQVIIMKQQKAVLDYIESLRGKTKIYINEELLK